MALSERLAFILSVDADGAIRGFQRVGNEADKSLGKAEDRLDRFGRRAQMVGAGMLAFAGVAGRALVGLANDASDLNEATSQTDVIFKGAANSVAEFAKSAVEIGQSERQAREAANTFGLFFTNIGLSSDAAADMSIEMAKLASDMASFKNTTPEDAIMALGAALRGESEPIRRYGVMLDDATLKQRALDMGLIETTTGTLPPAIRMQAAYAEVLAQTTTIQGDFERTSDQAANQQRILAAEFENLKANIGAGILPMFTDLLQAANKVAGVFADLSPESQALVGKLAAIGTAGIGAVGALSLAAGTAVRMRNNFSSMNAEGVRSINTFGKMAVGIGAFSAVIGTIFAVKAGLDALGISAKGLEVDIEAASRATSEELASSFLEAAQAGDDLIDPLKLFGEIAEGNIGTAARLRDAVLENSAAFEEAGVTVADLDAVLRQEAEAQRQAAADSNAATDAIDEETDAMQEQRDAAQELMDGILALANADLGLRQSQTQTRDATVEYTEALRLAQEQGFANEEQNRELEQSGYDLETATLRQAAAAVSAAEANVELAGGELSATEAAQIQIGVLQSVAQTLAPGDPLRSRLEGYIAQLEAVPGEVTTKVNADTSQAEARLNSVLAKLRQATNPHTIVLGAPPIGARADGGPVSHGRPYVVGEEGPELFVPNGSGTIIPNDELGGTTPGGLGGIHIENVTIQTNDPDEFLRKLRRLERQG